MACTVRERPNEVNRLDSRSAPVKKKTFRVQSRFESVTKLRVAHSIASWRNRYATMRRASHETAEEHASPAGRRGIREGAVLPTVFWAYVVIWSA